MKNRTHKTILLLTSLVFGITSCNSDKRISLKKPNIIYIMADDLTTQAISAYDGIYKDIAPTPNIDKVAKEGMLFQDVLVTNSICGPSRAANLRGNYSNLNDYYTGYYTHLRAQERDT